MIGKVKLRGYYLQKIDNKKKLMNYLTIKPIKNNHW